jgi:hypothetical protein
MPELKIGDRVKVKNQCLTGVIVRWDGADAVVLADVDDDRDEWMEEDDDGTFVCSLSELQEEEEARLEAERIVEELIKKKEGENGQHEPYDTYMPRDKRVWKDLWRSY